MNITPPTHLYDYLSTQYSALDQATANARLDWLYTSTGTEEQQENDDTFCKEYTQQQDNIEFWRKAILHWSLTGRFKSSQYCLTLDVEKLNDIFYQPSLGKPVSLSCVVADLERTNDIVPIDMFYKKFTTTSWLKRISTVIKTPKQWSLLAWSTPSVATTVFVVLPSIRMISEHILWQHQQHGSRYSNVDAILTFTEFRSKYGDYKGTALTDADLWLLLRYMYSQYGLAVDPNVRGYGQAHVAIKLPEYSNIVSFAPTGMPSLSRSTTTTISRAEINDSDRAIISLKTTCKALHEQIDELQVKMEGFVKKSVDCSRKKQKLQALYALKKKHRLEDILHRRLRSLETMETLLLKIDASHNDKQIIQAFNIGVKALNEIVSKGDLTVTSVNETMAKMQSTLEEQKRVEDAITNGTEEALQVYNDGILDSDEDDKMMEKSSGKQGKEKRSRDAMETAFDHDSEGMAPIPSSSIPNSELARLQSILVTLPSTPTETPRSKQRRLQQQLA